MITVGDLKKIITGMDDTMPVIIPGHDEGFELIENVKIFTVYETTRMAYMIGKYTEDKSIAITKPPQAIKALVLQDY